MDLSPTKEDEALQTNQQGGAYKKPKRNPDKSKEAANNNGNGNAKPADATPAQAQSNNEG
jgi:hypothetical protein